MSFNIGDRVLFYHDDKVNYKTIYRIVVTTDGIMAQFEPGCACKTIVIPLDRLFKDEDKFIEYMKEKGLR